MPSRLSVMHDWGCWPLWDLDEARNLDPRALPISDELSYRLNDWAQRYDHLLDWDDPGHSDIPKTVVHRYRRQGYDLWSELQDELADDVVEIGYQHGALLIWRPSEAPLSWLEVPGSAQTPFERLIELVDTLHAPVEPDAELCSKIGVGPLENLIRASEDVLWDRVESYARRDIRFRRALAAAWAYDSPRFAERQQLLHELGETAHITLRFIADREDFDVEPATYRVRNVELNPDHLRTPLARRLLPQALEQLAEHPRVVHRPDHRPHTVAANPPATNTDPGGNAD